MDGPHCSKPPNSDIMVFIWRICKTKDPILYEDEIIELFIGHGVYL